MFIGAVAGLSLLVAEVYLLRATPLYTATTQVLLEAAEKAPTDTGATDYWRLADRSYIDNQLAILTSDALLRRVVLKEQTAVAKGSTETDISNQDLISAEAQAKISALRGSLNVSRNGQASVISIAITSTDPVRSAHVANAVADAYVINQLDARFESARRASAWLSDRLVELRQQLKNSEEAVTKFRSAHGLMRAGPTVALTEQQLSELNT